MNTILVYPKESTQYKRLELAAAMLTYLSPNRRRYHVETVWRDYGAEILWTTILVETGFDTFPTGQALHSVQQQQLLQAQTVSEIENVIREIIRSSTIDSGEVPFGQYAGEERKQW